MPKSSMAMRTPRSWSSSSSARARSPAAPSSTIAVSVTSSPRAAGARPLSSSASRTSALIPPADIWRAERFTQVTKRSGSSTSRLQRAAWAQASRITNSPSGRMSPVASATGMKVLGATSPRVGEVQRSSASTPTTCALSRSYSGW